MHSLSILAIDDDPLLGMTISAFVEQLGHRAVYAKSGADGLTHYARQAFDLVLVDWQMPRMDGLHTTAALRDLQQASGWRPIIMLSGNADTDAQVAALNAGCDDFISKPVNFQILEAKINSFYRIAQLQQQIASQHQELLRYAAVEAEERRTSNFLMERLVRREQLDHPLIGYLLQPTSEVSGDLLLACTSRSGDIYVMLADATGHGLPAALTLIPLSQTFYAMASKGFQLDSIAFELNHLHRTYSPPDRFVAALMAVFRPRESTLEVWNGGLPPAMLLDQNQHVSRQFRSLNLPLGIIADAQFSSQSETALISQQQHLLMYSDGLIEAENCTAEPFGYARLEQCIATTPAAQLLPKLQQAVEAHLAGSLPHDDLSCLLLDCRQPEPAATISPTLDGPGAIAASWNFQLSLSAVQLRLMDIEPLLTQLCSSLGLEDKQQGLFSLIIRELLTNAVDHGLLGLDSSLKNGLNGFENYQHERSLRLATLDHGQINIEISQTGSVQGNQLFIGVIDSGAGFAWQEFLQQSNNDPSSLYHGRGLLLIQQLCSNLEFRGRGNDVRVQLLWGGAET